MNFTEHNILLFFLILVRLTAMFASAPVFNSRGLPNLLKLGMAGLLSLLIFPIVDASTPTLELHLIQVFIIVFQEILTGLTIGLTLNFLFAGFELAGEYIGVDMGFSMAQEFDPTYFQQVTVLSRFKHSLALLIFLLIDGHHFLIESIAYSYRVLPISSWTLTAPAIDKIIKMSAQVFIIGVKIAAPAIVSLFLTSVAMGIIARAVPQMNIFFVGFPMRIFVGLISLIFSFPLIIYLFEKLLHSFENDITYLIKVL